VNFSSASTVVVSENIPSSKSQVTGYGLKNALTPLPYDSRV